MARALPFLWALVIFFGTVAVGRATPLYYTFDGEVSYVYDYYGTNVAANAGLSRGTPVTYTFLVDFELDGYYSYGSYTYVQRDRSYSYTSSTGSYAYAYDYDYFYAEYIDGDALTGAPYYSYDYNYGYSYDYIYRSGSYTSTSLSGYLYGESRLQITSSSGTVHDWSLGDRLCSTDYWSDPRSRYVRSNLTLSSISHRNPYAIPEPGALLLIGSGLLGLLGLRKRLQK